MRNLVVITGVSGSGKSSVAAVLARRLGVAFCEGDDLHPAANIAKMKAGRPLDDADRAPWLERIGEWLAAHRDGGVVSCSALRRAYRDRLRRGLDPAPAMVLLDPPRAVLERRVARRRGHFMPPSLLDSQLDTLERPAPDEPMLRISEDETIERIVGDILAWL